MKAFMYAAAAAVALTGTPVSAKVLQFVVKNTGGTDAGNFIFRLDDSVAPNIRTAATIRYNNVSVRYGQVPGLGNGTATTGVSFAPQGNGGGLAIGALGGAQYQFRGTSLLTNANFSGTTPLVFRTGTFGERLTPGSSVNNYSVTVTAVPEPATWALMIGGFGMAGAGLRRRAGRAVLV